jgi:hypothetical protein
VQTDEKREGNDLTSKNGVLYLKYGFGGKSNIIITHRRKSNEKKQEYHSMVSLCEYDREYGSTGYGSGTSGE